MLAMAFVGTMCTHTDEEARPLIFEFAPASDAGAATKTNKKEEAYDARRNQSGNIHIGLAFGGAAIGIGIATAGGRGGHEPQSRTVRQNLDVHVRRHGAGRRLGGDRLAPRQHKPAYETNLGIQWKILLAQTISFSIVLFVLWRFAYKPVFAMLEARRQKIAEGLANAEKIKAELARTEAERKRILAQAGDVANQMIEEARNAAARVREVETQKAIAAAEQIMAKAREAAAQDHARMLAELKTRSRTAGRANHRDRHRQNPDAGRPAAAGGGDGKATGCMKICR